jgi:hypothetical protein
MNDEGPDPADILPAARLILAKAADLLGDDAPLFSQRLSELIDRAADASNPWAREAAEDELYAWLASREQTRQRMDELLPEPSEQRSATTFEAPFADAEPPPRDRYQCPRCTFAWPVLSVDDPVEPPERCPVHSRQKLVFRAADDDR